MEKMLHNYSGLALILLMLMSSAMTQAAQPLSESSLASQTGQLNHALPSIIIKARQDTLKPEQERWRAQRAMSDQNLRDVRIRMLSEGGLSPYEEQKKTTVMDIREKKNPTIKPHKADPDRLVTYESESSNVHGKVMRVTGQAIDTIGINGTINTNIQYYR